MRHPGYYILNDAREPVPTDDVLEWGRFFERPERIVAQTDIGPAHVSTVFLGIDHRFGDHGPPLVFETMIFWPGNEELDQCPWRSSTWREAECQHAEACARVKETLT